MISNYYQEEGVQIHLSPELSYVLEQILGYIACENESLQQEILDLREFLQETLNIYKPDMFDIGTPNSFFLDDNGYMIHMSNIDILARR